MKFTYTWLKDYVDIKLRPQELVDKLTMAGLEIESLQTVDDDWVFSAEVTTNRPDWLSILGIAWETAAITGKKIKHAQSPLIARASSANTMQAIPQIQILDNQACPRYTARIINNVKVTPSPERLQKRLKSIGLRPVNNIVDITNFVMFETGQPLHAFDFDKLAGDKIIVRRAKDNEEIIAIDGSKIKLNTNTLVIADQIKPVAIAGIMGGRDTEVTNQTKNILLESAYFDPAIIRRTSKLFALISDSSYRFERGVNYEQIKPASDRAAGLIIESAGGSPGKFVDISKKKVIRTSVSLNPERINDLLGIKIPVKDITGILKSLGLKNTAGTKAKLTFTIPSWRRDLKKEIDLIEEIARIYGYDKIPDVQPKNIDAAGRIFMPKDLSFETIARDSLISFGLSEVITYSLADINNDGLCQKDLANSRIHLKNSLSSEFATLRTNLISGLLLSARWNLNRNINDIKLFEIGHTYTSLDKASVKEENYLGVCLSGSRLDNWQDGIKPVDFYSLKGIIEGLFIKLGIAGYEIRPIAGSCAKILNAAEHAVIFIDGKEVGFFGKVKKEILSEMDIEEDCFVCQINLEDLIKNSKSDKKFLNLDKFPAVYRDISILVDQNKPSMDIIEEIKKTAGSIIKDVKLFDVYSGEKVKKGCKGLAYHLTYQSPDKTLTYSEVENVHSRIIADLQKLGVQIR